MFGKNPDPNLNKEKLSKHLRTADEFTRFQRYEEALMEIDKALALDPKNNMARSFQERVRLLLKRSQKETRPDTTELTLEQRMALISQLLAEAEQYVGQQDYKRALDKVAEVYKIDPTNYYAQAFSDRIEQLQRSQSEESAKLFTPATPQIRQEQQAEAPIDMNRGSLQMYRELLKEVWFDGKVTDDEAAQLKRTRDIFTISQREHQALEREVKVEAYVEALRLAWRDGLVSENERRVLESMRERYGISAEEHSSAEEKIRIARRATGSLGVILIVDPAREGMAPVGRALQQRGYDVMMASRVEDAYQVLTTQVPDVIISEIYFSASAMDGFTFFAKAKEHPSLRNSPFIFISSVRDANVIRSCVRLGADYFLPKPVDPEFLLAVIDGKKRKL